MLFANFCYFYISSLPCNREALSGICLRTIQHPDSQVNKLAISPDKRFLAAAGNTLNTESPSLLIIF